MVLSIGFSFLSNRVVSMSLPIITKGDPPVISLVLKLRPFSSS